MSSQPEIFSHLTAAERDKLTELARRLPKGAVAVEIGSYLGASACALAEGLQDIGGRLFAIDTWTNLAMSEGPRDTFADFRRNTASYGETIQPIRGTSLDVAPSFPRTIDFLFVDADHSYEAVRADLEAWRPHLARAALVVMHDYGWAEGVRRAVRDSLAPYQLEGGHRLGELYWARVDRDAHRSDLRASLIIPTRERPEYLADALEGAAAQDLPNSDHEVLVVDNAPSERVEQIVEEASRRHETLEIRYLAEPRTGLHRARHRGAREARGEILAYVDDDVLLPAGWLAAILEPFGDPNVAVVGGKVEPRWEAPVPDWWRHFPDSYLSLLDLGGERKYLDDPGLIYGCNMAVRRAVLFQLGGFPPDSLADPQLKWQRGDGETGLCRKALADGFELVYEPRAVLEHRIPAERLTPRAMRRRGEKSGLSASYARLRSDASRHFAWLRRLVGGLRSMAHGLRSALRARWPGRGDVKVRDAADAAYWLAYGGQHLRALVDPGLRRNLLRPTHLEWSSEEDR